MEMNAKEIIYDIRTKTGMSQRAFADKLGVTKPAVYQWEHGITSPSQESLESLKDSFNAIVPDECAMLEEAISQLSRRTDFRPSGKASPFTEVCRSPKKEFYKNIQPYAEISKDSYRVCIYDYAETKRGEQMVLTAVLNSHGENEDFRWEQVRNTAYGKFIRRAGIRFYFKDAHFVNQGLKDMLNEEEKGGNHA